MKIFEITPGAMAPVQFNTNPATTFVGGLAIQPPVKGDFDGDGIVDYLLFNPTTHRTAIWLLNGNTVKSFENGPNIPAGWEVACAGDMDGDGNPDYILFNGTTRQTAIYYLNGNTYSSSDLGPTLPPGWKVIAVADIDRDGNQDYVLFSATTHHTAVYFLNGATYSSRMLRSRYSPRLAPD